MPDALTLERPEPSTDRKLTEFQLRRKLDRLFHVHLELLELELPIPPEMCRVTREVCAALGLIR
jgi:hypothetical protein